MRRLKLISFLLLRLLSFLLDVSLLLLSSSSHCTRVQPYCQRGERVKCESRQRREVCGEENACTNNEKNGERRKEREGGRARLKFVEGFVLKLNEKLASAHTGGSPLFSSQAEAKNTFDQYLPVTLTSAGRRLRTIDTYSIDESLMFEHLSSPMANQD